MAVTVGVVGVVVVVVACVVCVMSCAVVVVGVWVGATERKGKVGMFSASKKPVMKKKMSYTSKIKIIGTIELKLATEAKRKKK